MSYKDTDYESNYLTIHGVSSSTDHDGGYVAANATDGNPLTGWAPWETPYVNNPQFRPEVPMDRRRISWLQVDLGASYMITDIELVTRQDAVGVYDGDNTRRNFEIRGSEYEQMTEENSTRLGEQGSTPVPPRSTWSCQVERYRRGPYRYIRATKTNQDYGPPPDSPWDFFITEFRVKGYSP
jgi:hypothetical protein